MAFILLWSAISRMAKQLISVWRAVVVVMLLCLVVVAGCDVRPFNDLTGNETSSSSDGTDDDGTDSTGDVPLSATPSEIDDVNVDSTRNVTVMVDNPVPDRTYTFAIEEPPEVSGETEIVEEEVEEGIFTFEFTATAPTEFGMEDTIGIRVEDSEGNEGDLDIPVTVDEEEGVPPTPLQSR